MYSKFFNNFLILFFPDLIFKKIIKEKSPFNSLISLLITALFFSSIGIFIYKKMIIPDLVIFLPIACLIIFCVFFLFILITALISFILDWIYLISFKFKGNNLPSDFFANFMAHAQVTPLWIFIIFLHVIFYAKQIPLIFTLLFVLIILRLLDIEARLVKTVYKLRLIQGYLMVLIQSILFLMGMAICAHFINY
ncbi:MAG: hypothetical protein ABIG64_06590 [Candidatus Omnitrophota bacterium]